MPRLARVNGAVLFFGQILVLSLKYHSSEKNRKENNNGVTTEKKLRNSVFF